MPTRKIPRVGSAALPRPTRCGVSGSRGVGGRSAPDADRIPVPHRRSGLRPRRLLIRRLIRTAVAEDPARGVGGVAPTYMRFVSCSPRNLRGLSTRSEEPTSELQSLLRTAYAVF